MPITLPTDQKQLAALVDRRHPSYADRLPHWEFCRATYDGGRDWFEQNLFKYLKEGDNEFRDRKVRAYRFNHTREVVHLVTKYIFKSEVIRNFDETPKELRAFWRNVTRSGLGIDEFMERISDLSSIYGRIWVGTDSLMPAGLVTRADEQKGDAKPYAFTLTPEDVLDYAWGEDGQLLWIKYRLSHRDDADPVDSSGAILPHYVFWTRDAFVVLEEKLTRRGTTTRREFSVVKAGENPLKFVPLFAVDDRESDNPFDVPGLIDDIAYLDRANANYLSNLDAIIQDQTFSQLVIPTSAMLPGDDGLNQMTVMGTKRIFTYDAGEGGAAPQFISPDPKQAGVILAIINKLIAEIYHSVGMAGERTKQDNAVGIDNSSGVAKAYDFERVNSLLTHKADVLERVEDRLLVMIAAWLGVELPKNAEKAQDGLKDLIKYPDSFDVRSLYDEFEIAEQFSLIQAPDELRREQMRALVKKLFPRIAQSIADKIEAGIKTWPPEPMELTLASMSKTEANPATGSLSKSPQGSVTKDTPASPKGKAVKPATAPKAK